jgi:hypothetical protein
MLLSSRCDVNDVRDALYNCESRIVHHPSRVSGIRNLFNALVVVKRTTVTSPQRQKFSYDVWVSFTIKQSTQEKKVFAF